MILRTSKIGLNRNRRLHNMSHIKIEKTVGSLGAFAMLFVIAGFSADSSVQITAPACDSCEIHVDLKPHGKLAEISLKPTMVADLKPHGKLA